MDVRNSIAIIIRVEWYVSWVCLIRMNVGYRRDNRKLGHEEEGRDYRKSREYRGLAPTQLHHLRTNALRKLLVSTLIAMMERCSYTVGEQLSRKREKSWN